MKKYLQKKIIIPTSRTLKGLLTILVFIYGRGAIHAQTWINAGSPGFSVGAASYTSIAIDGSGTPYVVYYDAGHSYKATVMKYTGGSWVSVGSPGFSAGQANYTSIAIDGSGTPYVVYQDYADSSKATVMKYNGSSWVNVGIRGFSASGAWTTSIAIDGSGTPYVVYAQGTSGSGAQTTVMKYNGSSWVTVGSADFSAGYSSYTTIAIDRSGVPYVAFEDGSSGRKATVMKYNGSGWVNVGSPGFSAGEAIYTSIAMDSNGTPYVVYQDDSNSEKTTVMKYTGSSWVNVGAAGFSAGEAQFTTIAIDGSGIPYVAYSDWGNSQKATVMKYYGGSWSNAGSPGFSTGIVRYTSIAIDGNGTPYVVYEDGIAGPATVMKLWVSPITGSNTVCSGATDTLSDTTAGGIWSSGNISVATVGSGTGVVTGISAGTAVITYNVAGIWVTDTVTVNYTATAGTITGATGLCTGATLLLTDAVAGGLWSSSNPGIATVSGGMVTAASIGVDTISYAVTSTCGTAVATTTISVNPLPAAITAGTWSLCAGSVTTLTDGSTGGTWASGNPAIAGVGATSGMVTGVSAGTVIITYSAGAGCLATAAVTVNAAPAAITGGTGMCIGATSTLTDSVTGGTWSAGGTIAGIGAGTGVVTGVSAGTETVTYTLGTGCYRTALVSVYPAIPAITGALNVCAGLTTALSDAAGGGMWSSGSTGIATISSGGVVTGVAAGTALISYSLGGCAVMRAVTVISGPAAITGPDSVCEAGATIREYDASPGGLWTSELVTVVDTTGVVTGFISGLGMVTYTLGTGCSVTRAITVDPLPSAITGAGYVCGGSTITLADASAGGAWSSSESGVTVSVGATTGTVTGLASGTAIITYAVLPGCAATTTITVNPAPLPITGPGSVCVGATITLRDSTLYVAGVWSSGDGAIAMVGSTGVVTGVSGGVAMISYTVNLCGVAVLTKSITVNPPPVVGAITGASTVCTHAAIILTDTTSGGAWGSANSNAIVSGGLVTGMHTGADTIRYSVTNICGTSTAQKAITIIIVPDAGSITGPDTVCAGAAITLSDSVAGGTWLCSNSHAAITGAGVVSGVTAGLDTVLYEVSNSCGINAAARIINILSLPAGTISGLSYVCAGYNDTLTGSPTGGLWRSSNATAFISTDGVVMGIMPGLDTIYYSLSGYCGIGIVADYLTVYDVGYCDSLTLGAANHLPTNPVGEELRVYPNPNTGTFEVEVQSGKNEPVHITISDMIGRTVKELDITTNIQQEINLEEAAGVYFLSADCGSGRYVVKVVKW